MNKFKAGDKVVRTTPYVATYDSGFMQEGNTYVIQNIFKDGTVALEGGDRYYSGSYFELVKPTFKAMKFKVTSPEQSKEVQEALFSIGYGWKSYGSVVMFTEDASLMPWIYTTEDGFVRIGQDGYSRVKSSEEYTIKTTKSYELIPVVEQVVINVEYDETVELMGQKYSKKELEDALRGLKPVV